MKLFSIRDMKVEKYGPPFPAPTEAYAVRAFASACNDPDHDYCKFSEDFVLFLIGEFDEASGQVEPVEPTSLGNGLAYKELE
jgi:hypothetical protein